MLIATGVPRGNGQVERIHKIVIAMLTKFCIENPKSWYKHIDQVERTINNTPPRSTKFTPFKILTGLKMRIRENVDMRELIHEATVDELN